MMSPRTLLILLSIAGIVVLWQTRAPTIGTALDAQGRPLMCRPPGMNAREQPVQNEGVQLAPFQLEQHKITPRAAFAVEATVLGAERYRFGREAEISPLDLALGWGRMANPAVYDALDVSQSGRWYRYRWGAEGPPIPLEEIISSSSNMHMIPATPQVAEALLDIRPGERVALAGWLVDVDTAEGFRWRTSLRRDDSGDGACEIVYVCEVTAP